MNEKLTRDDIKSHLVSLVAEVLEVPPEKISCDIPVSKLGVDSVTVVELFEKLGTWLQMDIEPTLGWDYPTIDAMASYLEGQYSAQVASR